MEQRFDSLTADKEPWRLSYKRARYRKRSGTFWKRSVLDFRLDRRGLDGDPCAD